MLQKLSKIGNFSKISEVGIPSEPCSTVHCCL